MQGEEIVEDEEERAPAPRPRKLRAPGACNTTRWSELGPKEIVRDMVCAAFPLHVCCRACFLPRAFLLPTLACKGESVYLPLPENQRFTVAACTHAACTHAACTHAVSNAHGWRSSLSLNPGRGEDRAPRQSLWQPVCGQLALQ